jgi:mRNA-degrading endonuclease RelE of RelBE toxin-antitoxin system
MEVMFSAVAAKQLKKIERGDRKGAKLIVETIDRYAENPQGKHDVKVLEGELGKFKRLRAGNYRIIFDEDGKVMYIYEVKHRQGAYHD